MLNMIEKPFRFLLQRSKNLLKSSETVQGLLYDLKNSEVFTNLIRHEEMLADAVRVDNYHEAISRYINPDDIVIDLGTGTGILSFFAAKQNPKKIYAVDHSEFIEVAEQIASHNDIKNIHFVKSNSRDFDPGEKVDVILHEQIGSELFNENMIENILDLKKRLLKDEGRILPSKFDFFIEPVSYIREYRYPYIWQQKINGVDFSCLRNFDQIEKYKRDSYGQRWMPASAFDYFLCEPEAVMSFDLEKLETTNDLPSLIAASKRVIRSGQMDALCIYFRVIFDDEISFDTSPFHTHTSWRNLVFRVDSKNFEAGENIEYEINVIDITNTETWTISIK